MTCRPPWPRGGPPIARLARHRPAYAARGVERKTVRYGFGGTLPTITNTITTTITITNDIRTIIDSFDAVIHMQECTVLNSASQAFLVRMQLTLHATHRTPHGASCLAQAMSAWPGETRCAPSRHCKDARVYGHTTTAVHNNEYTSTPHHSSPSPPPLPSRVILCSCAVVLYV